MTSSSPPPLLPKTLSLPHEGDLLRHRVVDVDLTLALADVRVVPVGDHRNAAVRAAAPDVEDPAVLRGHQAVRLADLVVLAGLVGLGQALGLVVGVDGGLAVGLRQTARPGQRAAQMVAEVGLGEARRRTAHGRVEGAAAVVVTAPGDRVVPAVGTLARAVGELPDPGHGVHVAGRVVLPVQPVVRALPLQREVLRRRVLPVADLHRGALHVLRTVRRRTGADQAGEPVGVRFGARRVMDAEEAAPGLHVGLQTRLLLRVEHIAAAGQEDDRVEGAELLAVGEDPGVVGGDGLEAPRLGAAEPDLLDGRDARVHGRRLLARRGVEHQDLDIGPAWRRGKGQRCRHPFLQPRVRIGTGGGRVAAEQGRGQGTRCHGRRDTAARSGPVMWCALHVVTHPSWSLLWSLLSSPHLCGHCDSARS